MFLENKTVTFIQIITVRFKNHCRFDKLTRVRLCERNK